MGPQAGHAYLGAAGKGGLLGLRNDSRPGRRLAAACLGAEVANRRLLRGSHHISDGTLRVPQAGFGQSQPPVTGAWHGCGRAPWHRSPGR